MRNVLSAILILIAVIIIGGALWRYVEVKEFETQREARIKEQTIMQDALGWGSVLHAEKKPDGLTHIRFMLRKQNHEPIKGANIHLTLSHSTEKGTILSQNTVTLRLTMTEPGVYRATTKIPHPGTWSAAINADIQGNQYQTNQQLTLE